MLHRFSMPRSLVSVSPAAQAVTAVMTDWEEEARDAIDLALVEALTNIVRHGPQGETRPIGIEATLLADRISVDIVDVTPPVPPDLLQRAGTAGLDFDPTDLQSIPESGRGLALILLMVDEASLHEDGQMSRLRLVRRR